ncbi:MAG: nucleoside deaminase, partial [Muribaculaceae bacterium]|nr:nucleoside deaminase [Muribaculaceae bacterium]
AHAYMMAITAAASYLGGKYLPQCTLYVTVEPCAMCAGALGWSQIGRIVYGTADPRRGFRRLCALGETPLHPRTEVCEGILADECRALMQSFFRRRR